MLRVRLTSSLSQRSGSYRCISRILDPCLPIRVATQRLTDGSVRGWVMLRAGGNRDAGDTLSKGE